MSGIGRPFTTRAAARSSLARWCCRADGSMVAPAPPGPSRSLVTSHCAGAHIFTANSNAAATVEISSNYSPGTGHGDLQRIGRCARDRGRLLAVGGDLHRIQQDHDRQQFVSRTRRDVSGQRRDGRLRSVLSTPTSSGTRWGGSTLATVKVSDGYGRLLDIDKETGATATDYGTGASDGTFTDASGAPSRITSLPSAITFQNPATSSLDGVNDYVDIPVASGSHRRLVLRVRLGTVQHPGRRSPATGCPDPDER